MKARLDRYKIKRRMDAIGSIDTFEDLARAADLGEATVYRSLDSHTWKSATLNAIAAALKCSPIDLLTVDREDTTDTRSDALAGLLPVAA